MNVAKLFGVAGKSVLVTGGGRGIGKYIAQAFVENGANVYISSRKADACARTADELNAAGPGRCVALVGADLGSPEGCAALVADLGQRVDALHVLINNSGTTWGEPFASYPDKAFERCFSLNVTAPFRLTRALLPLLDKASAAEDPARVINIGSIADDASKAAVHMLTRKLATELADRRDAGGHRITVNAIAPGTIRTISEQARNS